MDAKPLNAEELMAVEEAGAAWCGEVPFARLFATLKQAWRERDEARTNADFLRGSIGECHLMISRNTPEFRLKQDWETTTLPFRLQAILRERDALRAEVTRLETELEKLRGKKTD